MSGQMDKRLRKALNKQKAGKLDEARELYQRILRDDPRHYYANTILGIMYSEDGQFKKAEGYFNTALALDPNTALLQLALGNFYRLQGDLDHALQHHQRATELGPHLPDSFYAIGSILSLRGQNLGIAEQHLRTAVAIRPEYADAHFELGNVLSQTGRGGEALEHYRQAIALEPNYDNASTRFVIAAIEGTNVDNPPRDYVERVFDGYADTFETHVVEHLGYTVPTELRALFAADAKFANVLDLGCGTGMSGAAFRDSAGHLVGLDVSQRMIEKTAARNLYDELYVTDLNEFLEHTEQRFDLFIAADVFIYVGALERLFENVRKRAIDGAHLVFSTETCKGDGFRLLPSARYAHSAAYIEKLAGDHGFAIVERRPANIRKQGDDWLPGEIYKLAVTRQ